MRARYRRFATSVPCVRVPPREPDPSFPILEYHSTVCGLNVHKGGIKTVLRSGRPGADAVGDCHSGGDDHQVTALDLRIAARGGLDILRGTGVALDSLKEPRPRRPGIPGDGVLDGRDRADRQRPGISSRSPWPCAIMGLLC